MDDKWDNMNTAPKDGTMIMVKGYIDVTQKDKVINRPARFSPAYNMWVCRNGQIIFPSQWKPIL